MVTNLIIGIWQRLLLRMDARKSRVTILYNICSKYRQYSRFNSVHNWQDLCDHLKEKKRERDLLKLLHLNSNSET